MFKSNRAEQPPRSVSPMTASWACTKRISQVVPLTCFLLHFDKCRVILSCSINVETLFNPLCNGNDGNLLLIWNEKLTTRSFFLLDFKQAAKSSSVRSSDMVSENFRKLDDAISAVRS